VISLPEAARAWCERQLSDRIYRVSVLSGGVAGHMFGLRLASGADVVLRLLALEPWRSAAWEYLDREWAALQMLIESDVPAPRPLALDRDGMDAGDPALLMSRVRGDIDLVSRGLQRLEQAVETLRAIHEIQPPAGAWPAKYRSWAFESKMTVPPWSSDDGLYVEAFARLREPSPPYNRTFLHRDYYPANLLWSDGALTGVVDWNEACSGPADLDVAHNCSNLAGLHGVEYAVAFRQAYRHAGGGLADDPEAAAYWQVMDLVGFLPGPSGRESGATAQALSEIWGAHGRDDLSVELVRRRREDLLRTVLTSSCIQGLGGRQSPGDPPPPDPPPLPEPALGSLPRG
jgi:aminoglycoside phosphotransferase (APT) family kinase protein